MENTSLDLDLNIELTDTSNLGCRATLADSAGNKATSNFRLASALQQLDNILWHLGQARQFNPTLDSPEMQAVQQFGWNLFNLVFTPDLEAMLRRALMDSNGQNKLLRIHLHLPDNPTVIAIPWEYLYYPYAQSFLALVKNISLVRQNDMAESPEPLPVKPPLKILAVGESGLSANLSELKWRGLVAVDEVEEGALSQKLAEAEYHIVHFAAGVNTDNLETLNSSHPTLRLIILPAGLELARELVEKGLPAAFAMPYELTTEATRTFASSLYSALAEGKPADVALIGARQKLFTSGNEVEWGMLTLTSSRSDGKLFVLEVPDESQQLETQTAALLHEAKLATEHEEWGTAVARLTKLLDLEPTHAEALRQMEYVTRRQNMAELYHSGNEHFKAGNWNEALTDFKLLEAQDTEQHYPDIPELIAATEHHLSESQRKEQAASLFGMAQVAIALKDWALATEKLEAVVSLDPEHTEAAERLHEIRQQQEQAGLYATGVEHFEAQQWQAALECLRPLEGMERYPDVGGMLAEAEVKLAEEARRNQAELLDFEALKAITDENWDLAVTKLQEQLDLEPERTEINDKLEYARRQKEMAELYRQGRQLFEAEQWSESLEFLNHLRELDGLNQYSDVVQMIAESDSKLTEAQKQSQAVVLYAEAETAIRREVWNTAIRKLEVLIGIEPEYPEAREKLDYSRKQQALVTLYSRSLEHYEKGRWTESIDNFRQLQQRDTEGRYKDVAVLIAEAETRQREAQVGALYAGAQTAIAQKGWDTALQKLEAIEKLDPQYKDVTTLLEQTRALVAGGSSTNGHKNGKAEEEEVKLEFDLLIEQIETGQRASILASPGGKGLATFRLTNTYQQLDNLLWHLGQARRYGSTMDSAEMQEIKQFGWNLFNLVFPPELESSLRRALVAANDKDALLRMRLQLPDDPMLAALPWEYLYYPYAQSFLTLAHNISFVRYLPQAETPQTLPIRSPLKVLTVTSSPKEYTNLDPHEHWQHFSESVSVLTQRGLIGLERSRAISLSALQQIFWLGQYHVLHFTGPVVTDAQKKPVLMFEDESRQPSPVSAEELATLLLQHTSLRLVVLNTTQDDNPLVVLDYARMLVQNGLPAVIGMPYDLTPQASAEYFASFYDSLANSIAVDQALSTAREKIFASGNEVEWGTPTLFLSRGDGQLFSIEALAETQQRESQKAALQREAQAAIEREEWDKAQARLEALLAIDPTQTEAETKLNEIREQQTKAKLYANGREAYEAEDWAGALQAFTDLRSRDTEGQYYIVEWLLVDAQRKLEEQQKQAQLTALYSEAQTAIAEEEWDNAVKSLEAVYDLDPEYKDIETLLPEVQQKLEEAQARIPALYAEAEEAVKEENWSVAIEKLVNVLAAEPDFREAENILSYVRRRQVMDALYTTAQAQLEAKNWDEAEKSFAQLENRDKEGTFKEQIGAARTSIALVHEQINTQMGAARVAMEESEWERALEKLNGVLELDPNHAEARDRINTVNGRQTLMVLYGTGREHYAAGRWREAFDTFREVKVLDKDGWYQDADWFITDTQARINEASKQAQAGALFAEAQTAIERENWDVAIQKLENTLSLMPYYAEAQGALVYSRQQQEMANLYAAARAHYEGERWRDARDALRQLKTMDQRLRYPDVPQLLAEVEAKLGEMQRHARNVPAVPGQPGAYAPGAPSNSRGQTATISRGATTTAPAKAAPTKADKTVKKSQEVPAYVPPKVSDSKVNFRLRLVLFMWSLVIIALIALLIFNAIKR